MYIRMACTHCTVCTRIEVSLLFCASKIAFTMDHINYCRQYMPALLIWLGWTWDCMEQSWQMKSMSESLTLSLILSEVSHSSHMQCHAYPWTVYPPSTMLFLSRSFYVTQWLDSSIWAAQNGTGTFQEAPLCHLGMGSGLNWEPIPQKRKTLWT